MGSNNEIKNYYRNIKKMFPVNSKKEKQYLSESKLQIDEFCSNKDTYDYQALEKKFGTPIDIVVSYYENIDSDYILNRINKKNYIKSFIVVCIIILIAALSYRYYLLQEAYNEFQNAVPESSSETIIEEKIN